eukprot:gb/GFBE01027625.1/.p1 GENE.gb/GFBE01027625.1/~~gb/GFBE01027625.1/.p1  ORF type:complete len:907 (+),score=277.78 gb/GFBE01027625.1/:1-2721(+)
MPGEMTNDLLVAALRAKEEELSSSGRSGRASGHASGHASGSVVSEARDSLVDERPQRIHSQAGSSGAGAGQVRGTPRSGSQSLTGSHAHTGSHAQSRQPSHHSASHHSGSKGGSSHGPTGIGGSSQVPSTLQGNSSSGISSIEDPTLLADKVSNLRNVINKAEENLQQGVEKVKEMKNDAIEKLQKDLAKAKRWARRAEEQRDQLEEVLAGKKAVVEQEEAAQAHKAQVTEVVKEELMEEEIKKQEAQEVAEEEKKKKEARFEMLEAQVKQAKDALKAVKAVAEEVAESDDPNAKTSVVAQEAQKQLNNVHAMARMRLEMCGLKFDSEGYAIQEPASSSRQREMGTLGVTPSKMAMKGIPAPRTGGLTAQFLNAIEEEEDMDDESRSMDQRSRFGADSECVSSDHGDQPEVKSPWATAGITDKAARAKVNVLKTELEKERAAKSAIKKEKMDLKVEASEQQAQIERLKEKLDWVAEMEEHETWKKQELKSELMGEMLEKSKQKAELTMQIVQKETTIINKAQEEQVEMSDLQERLNYSQEQLRIANQRIEDLKYELNNVMTRHDNEINDLRDQLEFQKAGSSSNGADSAGGEENMRNKILEYRKLVGELQEEISTLQDKLEANNVQHSIQLDELKHEYEADRIENERKHKHGMEALKSEMEARPSAARPSTEAALQPQAQQAARRNETSCNDYIGKLMQALTFNFEGGDRGGSGEQVKAHSVQEVIWELLSNVLNFVVISCNPSTLTIRKVSLKAFEVLGEGLPGKLLFTLLSKSSEGVFARRVIINHYVSRTDEAARAPGCTWHEVGVFEFQGGAKRFYARMIAVHLEPETEHEAAQEENVYIILIAPKSKKGVAIRTGSRSASSVASADITPSDSISMIGGRPYEFDNMAKMYAGSSARLRTQR